MTLLGLSNRCSSHRVGNQPTQPPAEIDSFGCWRGWTSATTRLTSVPAAIRELEAAECEVLLDDGVTVDE